MSAYAVHRKIPHTIPQKCEVKSLLHLIVENVMSH